MLKELLSIFGGNNPMHAIASRFSRMLSLARENTLQAGEILFGGSGTTSERDDIYGKDVEINKLERSIRKRVVAHLSFPGNTTDVPYCLLMMSLVKDVERIGDYAKNVSEVTDFQEKGLPEDDLANELRSIRRDVEKMFQAASEVLESSHREQAMESIQIGRDIAHRCDRLIVRVARSDYDAATAAAVALGSRYYKRIGGHLLNLLSSVVMPLHKVDYYDEDAGTT